MYWRQTILRAVATGGGVLIASGPALGRAPDSASIPAHNQWRTGTVPIEAKPKAQIRDAIVRLHTGVTGRHIVAAFDAPITPADRGRLESAGLLLLSYLGNNTFFASLSSSTVDAAALSETVSLIDVRAVNRQRRSGGLELVTIEAVPWRRRIYRPFASGSDPVSL